MSVQKGSLVLTSAHQPLVEKSRCEKQIDMKTACVEFALNCKIAFTNCPRIVGLVSCGCQWIVGSIS